MSKYHIEMIIKNERNKQISRSFISVDAEAYQEFTRSVQNIKIKKDKI